jgi:hypothetical protein
MEKSDNTEEAKEMRFKDAGNGILFYLPTTYQQLFCIPIM